jgi:hypothetical protein
VVACMQRSVQSALANMASTKPLLLLLPRLLLLLLLLCLSCPSTAVNAPAAVEWLANRLAIPAWHRRRSKSIYYQSCWGGGLLHVDTFPAERYSPHWMN